MAKKKIKISGSIVPSSQQWIYDYFEIESCSPKSIENQLKNVLENEEFEVEINSGGGEIFAGSEIYTLLSKYKDRMVINIVGLAASAASVIAMAGKSYISPTAMMMVHNVSTGCSGDNRDMAHMADVLKNANEAMASAYVNKSGMTMKEALKMMDAETWLTAEQAKEKGLVDGIMFKDYQLVASYNSGLLPPSVIEKMEAQRQTEFLENKTKLLNKYKNLGGTV